jgi:hypothetical protein
MNVDSLIRRLALDGMKNDVPNEDTLETEAKVRTAVWTPLIVLRLEIWEMDIEEKFFTRASHTEGEVGLPPLHEKSVCAAVQFLRHPPFFLSSHTSIPVTNPSPQNRSGTIGAGVGTGVS